MKRSPEVCLPDRQQLRSHFESPQRARRTLAQRDSLRWEPVWKPIRDQYRVAGGLATRTPTPAPPSTHRGGERSPSEHRQRHLQRAEERLRQEASKSRHRNANVCRLVFRQRSNGGHRNRRMVGDCEADTGIIVSGQIIQHRFLGDSCGDRGADLR